MILLLQLPKSYITVVCATMARGIGTLNNELDLWPLILLPLLLSAGITDRHESPCPIYAALGIEPRTLHVLDKRWPN